MVFIVNEKFSFFYFKCDYRTLQEVGQEEEKKCHSINAHDIYTRGADKITTRYYVCLSFFLHVFCPL